MADSRKVDLHETELHALKAACAAVAELRQAQAMAGSDALNPSKALRAVQGYNTSVFAKLNTVLEHEIRLIR